MDLRRLRMGEWLTGLAGIVLLVSLQFDWYEFRGPPLPGGDVPLVLTSSAWRAFSVLDVLLVAVGVLAIANALYTAIAKAPSGPISVQSLSFLCTTVVAIVVLVRLAVLPDSVAVSNPVVPDAGTARTAACWIGSLAAVAIPVALMVAMRDERLSKPGDPTDATGAPLTREPAIETLPAPPA